MSGLITPRMLIPVILAVIAAGAVLAWLAEQCFAPREIRPPVSDLGPAPWEVSEVIEEARRITREASE